MLVGDSCIDAEIVEEGLWRSKRRFFAVVGKRYCIETRRSSVLFNGRAQDDQ